MSDNLPTAPSGAIYTKTQLEKMMSEITQLLNENLKQYLVLQTEMCGKYKLNWPKYVPKPNVTDLETESDKIKRKMNELNALQGDVMARLRTKGGLKRKLRKTRRRNKK